MIFDPRDIEKQQQAPVEVKSSTPIYAEYLSFPEYLFNNGMGDLSAFAAIQLYMDAMPLFNAIAMRAEAFSQIPIKVRDKNTKEFVDSHPDRDWET